MPTKGPSSSAKPSKPQIVYHYTSMDTMLKIVDTQKIWATQIDYLNDDSEGAHFLKFLYPRLSRKLLKEHGFTKEALDGLDPNKYGPHRPYVASFSSDANSLPQWRAYCPTGNGVAIGFRVECLENADLTRSPKGSSPSKPLKLAKVRYVTDDISDREIASAIKNIASHANRAAREYPGDSGQFTPDYYFSLFARVDASRRKHASFKEESEYRLLVMPLLNPGLEVKFRASRTTLVPYVELDLEAYRTSFIARLIVGPAVDRALSTRAAKQLFERQKMDVDVDYCGIPLREL